MIFRDRRDAGQQLAKRLLSFHHRDDVLVIGLPRGGVMVAAEVANALCVPLDIVVPRKIGAPGNPEYAIGAITEEGEFVGEPDLISTLGVSSSDLSRIIQKERTEAQRRLKHYRGNRPPLMLEGKTAIVVDDGIATGATMKAAIRSIKNKGAERLLVAAPVASPETVEILRPEVDEIVILDAPQEFAAVGMFYDEFEQTTDEEVIQCLER
jgi:putative phosphoribosyl transferase